MGQKKERWEVERGRARFMKAAGWEPNKQAARRTERSRGRKISPSEVEWSKVVEKDLEGGGEEEQDS